MKRMWIRPEYCGADFYTGWHLYACDRNDGSVTDDGAVTDDGEWLQRGLGLDAVWKALRDVGVNLTRPMHPHSTSAEITAATTFIEEFVAIYPDGLDVERVGNWEYRVIDGRHSRG